MNIIKLSIQCSSNVIVTVNLLHDSKIKFIHKGKLLPIWEESVILQREIKSYIR
jgi:hypothetical protein